MNHLTLKPTENCGHSNVAPSPAADAPFLEAWGLQKSYQSAAGRETILRNVDISIQLGEVLAITAPSGAGKSTLLKILGGLEMPDGGTVNCAGTTLDFRDGRQLAALRAYSIGFIFQRFNLVPFLNAHENVELALKLRTTNASERRSLALAALTLVGLGHKVRALPATMSGGEQQRVAVARAIAGAPSLLLCDEPTGSLSQEAGQQVFDLLHTFAYKHRRAVVLVTHNESLAQQATRRLYLRDGHLEETSGAPS